MGGLLLAVLAAVTIFAVRSDTQIAQADHTGGSSIFTADLLMLDTTLETHGGSQTPVEVEQAALLGLTVDVVSAATWGTMTAADFSHYKALVLGDPHCKVGTPSGSPTTITPISAAEANRSVWGPEVTGNVVVIGTDPDFHRTQGGAALTKSGLAFAAAEPGKTGAYITLSCYYFNVPTSTPVPVPVLDQFGSFTVHGQNVPGGASCPAQSHIVATHPALAGLTDANLSNWGCSFHEGFVLPLPSDFLVLAIALDVPSTFVAADGTSGTPYIIARGVEVISDIDLAPDGVVNPVGTSHTVTATVTTDDPAAGTPIVGTTVTFTVISGPHVGTTGTGVTDGSGVAIFTYTGTSAGVDTIEATFADSTGTTQTSNTVEKTWEVPPVTFLIIDEDSIDNGTSTIEAISFGPPSCGAGDSAVCVNDDIADPGVRTVLFTRGNDITPFSGLVLPTGEVGDEGLFRFTKADPQVSLQNGATFTTAGFFAAAGAAADENNLDKIDGVVPLGAADIAALEGKTVCALVYDSDISVDVAAGFGSLKGATLGLTAFTVTAVLPPGSTNESGSSSSLPDIQVDLLPSADVQKVCESVAPPTKDLDS